MISSSSTLPVVVIFERHWDKEVKQVVKDLVPKLSDEGYDTLCVELPQGLTEEEILSFHRQGLDFDIKLNSQAHHYLERGGIKGVQLSDLGFNKLTELMKSYVSSQRYLEVAERLKALPASILFRDILSNAKNLHLSIKGIDATASHQEITAVGNPSQRMKIIEKHEEVRISTIFENLLSLHKEGKNIVFVAAGALHADNLINKFKEKNLEDKVLYYFPHSNQMYEDSFDDIQDFSKGVLKNREFCLLNEQDRKDLIQTMINEIKSNNLNYKEKIVDENSHSQILSDVFNQNFKTYLRSGSYLDACLDTSNIDDCENIVKKLEEVDITTSSILLEGRTHLVIRDVNTKEVADNIRRLR